MNSIGSATLSLIQNATYLYDIIKNLILFGSPITGYFKCVIELAMHDSIPIQELYY